METIGETELEDDDASVMSIDSVPPLIDPPDDSSCDSSFLGHGFDLDSDMLDDTHELSDNSTVAALQREVTAFVTNFTRHSLEGLDIQEGCSHDPVELEDYVGYLSNVAIHRTTYRIADAPAAMWDSSDADSIQEHDVINVNGPTTRSMACNTDATLDADERYLGR